MKHNDLTEIDDPPYYAVIFTSLKREDTPGYEAMDEKMMERVKNQRGFIGVDSLRGEDGYGITISYWKTLDDIRAWKRDDEHAVAQRKGRSIWYEAYKVKVCMVEREYGIVV